MSAIGPKRTFPFASRMSTLGGKADIDLLGVNLCDPLPKWNHGRNTTFVSAADEHLFNLAVIVL
jgi:hypothetical protein